MKLVLKLDEDGKVVTDGNKVIYEDEDADNKEYPLDPPSMYAKIIDLGKENKKHRDKVTAVEAKYLPFADIEDIEVWKKDADKAIDTVANFNDKDFVEAGKVEKVKAEMREAYEAKLTSKDNKAQLVEKAHVDALGLKDKQIRTLMISNRFSVSPHFNGEKSITTMPPDVAESFFGNVFKVKEIDGKLALRAYQNGEELISLQNPGEPADFEEAISMVIDKYPNKDSILRAPGGGSGGSGGGGGDRNDPDELTKLNRQLTKAVEDNNIGLSIAIKNKIFKLKQSA